MVPEPVVGIVLGFGVIFQSKWDCMVSVLVYEALYTKNVLVFTNSH